MAATEEQVSQIATALASCDTVDGYSLIGVADETTVDVNGDPIAAGAETIDFYDGDGEYLYSCEKEGPDGWAELGVAGEETVDINGDPIAPGTEVIDFYDADGVYVASCEKAVADGYAVQGIADADTVDANDNPIDPGEPVIHFYDGDDNYLNSCLKESADGWGEQGVAGVDTVDSNGDPIAPGTEVIDFYDANGEYVDSWISYTPEQELYGPGDDLPDTLVGSVDVNLDDGSVVTLSASDTIPVNATGDVFVDEVTGEAACIAAKHVFKDCEGNLIDPSSETWLTDQRMAAQQVGLFIAWPGYANTDAVAGDADFCVPAVPICPQRHYRTTDIAKGVDWYWDTAAWVMCGFCALTAAQSNSTQYADPEILDWDDAALAGLLGEGLIPRIDLEKQLKNTDCVPWCVRTHFRTHSTGSLIDDNYMQISMGIGPNHSPSQTHYGRATQWNWNTLCNRDGCFEVEASGDLNTYGKAIVQPGETVNYHLRVSAGLFAYKAFALNRITIGSTFINCQIERVKP